MELRIPKCLEIKDITTESRVPKYTYKSPIKLWLTLNWLCTRRLQEDPQKNNRRLKILPEVLAIDSREKHFEV